MVAKTTIKPEPVGSSLAPRSHDRPRLKRAEPSMVNLSLGMFDLYATRDAVAQTLYFLLALTAFFDFCATVLVDFVPSRQEDEFISTHRKKNQIVIDTDDALVFDIVKFLDQNYVPIGICFSLLWFICSFIKAQWVRDRKLRDLDRKRLLGQESMDAKTFESDVKEFQGAWDAYYGTVGFQLLLLPVGFYLYVWKALLRVANPSELIDDVEVDVVYTADDGKIMAVEHRFTTHSTHSLLVAILHYCAVVIKQSTGVQLEYSAEVIKKKVIHRVIRFLLRGLRHPKQFVRRLRKTQTFIRWFKYLAPIIGTGNKLLGNIKDLVAKQQQYLSARRAKRIRKQFWKLMSDKERREAAAIRIQKCYRAMRVRKAFKALQLLQGTKESIAAIRMQTAIRAALARAKTRLLLKERELDRLEAEADATSRDSTAQMSVDDRRRMYELQNELNTAAKRLVNEKLLLHPNTSFAVTWKVLFVICVIFEITQLVIKPKLDKYIDEDTGKRLDIGEILDDKLVPAPMTEWEECAFWLIDDEQLEKDKKGFFKKIPRRRKQKKPKKLTRPWFCREPYVTMQSMYINVVRFILSETLVIIAVVCYLDVFVTFFTGTFDSDTGILEPKPFFTRWFIPGLTLQLLVNPRMESTAEFVFQLLSSAWRVGPIRVYRWSKALFFPLFVSCMSALERWVWIPLVDRENSCVLQR